MSPREREFSGVLSWEAIEIKPFDFNQPASFYTCELPGCGVRIAVNFGHALHGRLCEARLCPIHLPPLQRRTP